MSARGTGLPGVGGEAVTPLTDFSGAAVGERLLADMAGRAVQAVAGIEAAFEERREVIRRAKIAEETTRVEDELEKLEAEHQFDPDGYAKAVADFRTGYVEKGRPDVVADVARVIDQRGQVRLSAIRQRRATADTKAAEGSLQQRRGVLLARLGSFATPEQQAGPEYAQAFSEYVEVERALGRPEFGSSPELAEQKVASTADGMRASAVLAGAAKVYEEKGLAAARTFVEGVVGDPQFRMTDTDRQRIENQAREKLNLLHQAEVEAERERREREREQREAQRDRADDLLFGVLTGGARMSARQLDQMVEAGEITQAQANRLFTTQRSEQRRAQAEARAERRAANAESRLALLEAAGGDRAAVRRATRLAERGVITRGELRRVAEVAAAAESDPGLADAIETVTQRMESREDDLDGAVTELIRRRALNLMPPGKERDAALTVVKKYSGRARSTLQPPLFAGRTLATPQDVGAVVRLTEQRFREGAISKAVRDAEMRNLAVWNTYVKREADAK